LPPYSRGLVAAPSYAVVSRKDRKINPDLERFMVGRAKSETIELRCSNATFLWLPEKVVAFTENAAKAAQWAQCLYQPELPLNDLR